MTTLELLARLRELGIKLWTEGDRLRFQAPKGALTPELRDALVERKAEVIAFLHEASVATQEAHAPILPAQQSGDLPLSFAQQRLWFLDQLEPGSALYNIPSAVRLLGPLDTAALQRSLDAIVERHAVLRTTFAMAGQQPIQVIAPPSGLPLERVDLRATPPGEREALLHEHASVEGRLPFDLMRGPLIRAKLMQAGDEDHLLLVTMHHIISDGWSISVMTREIALLYAAFATGRSSPLLDLPIQYADFAIWQRDWLDRPDASGESPLQRQISYWKRQLSGAPTAIELPVDRPRAAVQTFNGAKYEFALPTELVVKLHGLSKSEGASLFMTLLAAFQVLLARHSGQEDIVVGTPIANRTRPEIEPLIGFFVNTLVLRGDLSGNPTFRQLLRRVRETTLGAYANQDVPFERLVEELKPPRDLSRNPLFQVMMVLQNVPGTAVELAGLTLRPEPMETATAKFDIELGLVETQGRLLGEFNYNTDLFDAETIARMAGHFQTLLAGVAAEPDLPISRLRLLSDAERQQLLVDWNAATQPFATDRLAHQLVAAHATRAPQALALADGRSRLSFAELDARAERLAHFLRAHGAGPDVLVGVCLDRSVEMVLAELAVLKAGAAYVPMDPAHPAERLAFLAHDAQVALLLTQQSLLEQLPTSTVRCVCLDTDWPTIAQAPDTPAVQPTLPEHLAYVIYTSGSTGTPKGVAISHASLLNLIAWHQRAYDLSPADHCTQLAGPGFDASVWEIWPALTAGAALHIADETTRLSPPALRDWLVANQIGVCFVPTPVAEELIRLPWPQDTALRFLLTGGDRLTRRPPAGLPFALVNHYGPTECTVLATAGIVAPEAGQPDAPVIGKVVPNAALYVLDRHGQPVPIGVPGELYIGGAGVARGYWNRPELTAERFVPFGEGTGGLGLGAGETHQEPRTKNQEPGNAASDGSNLKRKTQNAKLYKTGDLVRYRADGSVEFLGRIDAQVKLRGFRIELGEIEAVLRRHPAVRDAVVLARAGADGAQMLAAYVVPSHSEDLTVGGLRKHLQTSLPEYMVPSAFVTLDAFPLTPNGKLDRKALPAPDTGRAELESAYLAPRTHIEAVLAELWSDVLHMPQVGVNDNFFELGGHSLLATQLVSRIREVLHVELPLRQVFAAPTVAMLAELVETTRTSSTSSPITAVAMTQDERRQPQPLSFAQERLWFLDQLEPGSSIYNIPSPLRLTGHLDEVAFERSLNTIVERHETLRTSFGHANGQPVQLIAPPAPIKLARVDLRSLPDNERQARVQQVAFEEAETPFDLTRGPLLRVTLVSLAEHEAVVLFTMHHIISDGWSISVIMRELSLLYSAFVRGEAPELPALPVQYADFARWQRDWLDRPDASGESPLQRQIGYWKRQLAGAPAAIELPIDRPRPPVQTFNATSLPVEISPAVTAALQTLSQREGASLFMTLLAAWQILLARYSGQDDIVVGTPIAGRTRTEIEPLIGFFVNTLVLRNDLSGNPSFRQLLGRVRETTLGAYDHQDLPFERLVEELKPPRDLSRSPLFQVMMVLQNVPTTAIDLPDLTLSPETVDRSAVKFELELMLFEQRDQLIGYIGYNTDLFDATTIARMIGHLQTLLEGIAADPDRPIRMLPMLTEAERRTFAEWNRPPWPLPPAQCLHELVAQQAARTPNATALVAGTERLSYRELDTRANRLAHLLRAQGVRSEQCAGVCLPRNAELVIALLAVLKTGAAYVPLDPAYPADRIAFMLADSQASLLIASAETRAELPFSGTLIDPQADAATIASQPDTAPTTAVTPDNLAYLIYTSGSTGRPKGVAIAHHTAAARLAWAHATFTPQQLAGVLASTSVCFDLSIFELFAPLSCGGTVILAENALALPTLPAANEVTLVNTVPSAMAALLRNGGSLPPSVDVVNLAGEPLPLPLVQQVYAQTNATAVYNLYGPSEDTTYSTAALIPPDASSVTIGRPLPHTQAFLLDRHGQPVPLGVIGEVYLGGAGITRGYFARPELTAERFIPMGLEARGLRLEEDTAQASSPSPLASRLYKTGDLARWRPDGTLDYLGRIDHQVKLRGFRIELGEIESALRRHPDVRDVVVVAREDTPGDKRIVAYVVLAEETRTKNQEPGNQNQEPRTKNQEPGAEDADNATRKTQNAKLRSHLAGQLPDYMVPSAFVMLEALPLTPNGKVDRKALPAPDGSRPELERAYVAPRTPSEVALSALWSDVLHVPQVGIHDNFFELGGHSLLATQLVSRIRETFHVELPLRQVFAAPTVALLAELVEGTSRQHIAGSTPPLLSINHAGPQPLSYSQERLWFLDQLEPGSPLYNIPAALRFSGPLDEAAFEHSVNMIVERHESLRTTFVLANGQPVQLVAPPAPIQIERRDLGDLPADEREARALALANEEAQRPFDLVRGPLLRVALLRLAEDETMVLFTMHHIIADGWSIGVIMGELVPLYNAFVRGEELALPPLPIQYAEFAIWQRNWLQGEVLERQIGYWKQQLGSESHRGAVPLLNLPTDRPRPPVQTFNGNTVEFALPQPLVEAITALSQHEQVTPFMTLLAAFQVLLARYSGQDDIAVGTPIAGRTRAEIEPLIGCFINMLVLRGDVSGNPSFQELLGRVRQTTLGAYDHQDLPFEVLVDALRPARQLSHNPLFQVMFVMQNLPTLSAVLGDGRLSTVNTTSTTTKTDLALKILPSANSMQGILEYNIDLFDHTTAERMVQHYLTLLEALVADPRLSVADAPLLSPAEQQQLAGWNATGLPFPQEQCFHTAFEAQVERSPDAVAVVFGDTHLTYRALNTRANQLAHHLRTLGVGPETLVGLAVERSVEMLVGLLGILKAGGAYLPLDLTYPEERLRFMVEDAQTPVLLIAGGRNPLQSDSAPWVTLDLRGDWPTIAAQPGHNPASGATPGNLAYVIYTSGSTGRPKGVMIEHRSVLNHAAALHQAIYRHHTGRPLRVSLNAPVSFDASVQQLVMLLQGHALYILPDGIRRDGRALVQYLRDQRLDGLDCVPSQLKLLLDAGLLEEGQWAPALVLAGGEAIDPATWQRLAQAPQTRFYNVYGPTECTVDSTTIDAREQPGRPTIGRPLANATAWVLDRHGQPVPIGVPGELHIGGAGLARGYLGRPELTAERFIPVRREARGVRLGAEGTAQASSLKPQASRLYKTGDLVRWLPNGTLEFLGRVDQQVKLRGFRIELDEIEAVLREHPAVREAVVVVREDTLVAYIVPAEEPSSEAGDLRLEAGELKTHLKERLPDYMVPALFVALPALPLTPNGKIDRKALPALDAVQLESGQPYEAPRTQLEGMLAGLWAEHFRIERVGIHDNFFELGGNSIQAAVLVNRLQAQIGEYVSVIALFEAPTVADLASYLAQHHGPALARLDLSASQPGAPGGAGADALYEILPVPRGPDTQLPLSFAQQRLWFLDQLEPASPLYNVPTGVRMRGTLDTAALQRSLDRLVERHESLRTAFGQIDGQPVQLITPAASLPVDLLDLSTLPPGEREQAARRALVAEAQRPFDLSSSPLARALLLRLASNEHILLLNLHHIISDGWSMGVLIRELAALYSAQVRGMDPGLPPLPVQYADFAVWQRQWFQGRLLEQQLAYWKQQLAGAPAALDLPTDRPRPPVQTFRGSSVSFQLPAALSQALATLSRREGATMFMTLLAAFQTLLFRYSGQEDILIGSPIANRTRKEIEGLIGFFVNTLVLRGNLSGNPTFRRLLAQTRETALGAFSHQDLPFEYLVEAIQPERDLSRSPLFQVMLVLQNTPSGALNLPGLTLEALDAEGSTAKFDLLLALVELPSGLAGDLEYNTDLFDRTTIERMLAHFQALLEGIVASPEQRIGDLPLLDASERTRLLVGWNNTAAPYPALATHQLVERQAARTPKAVAVVAGEARLTYAELDARANQLAHHLLAAGVGPDMPVGICMERSLELVVGILGILKAGGAYIPLDPHYPPERLALMLDNARATVLLTKPGAWQPGSADGRTVIDLEADWPAISQRPLHAPNLAVGLDQLAYVIYTSGSTGVPKGVAMPHRPLANLIAWQETVIPGAARTLQFASPSFDVSFQEIFTTWASGGTLVLPPEALRRDPEALVRFLNDQRIERLFMPFVALQQLAEAIAEEGRAPAYLRDVITAGEQLLITPAIARWFAAEPRPRLHNHYGPSETHVVTAHTLEGDPASWPGLPPIGKPIANTQAYILDRAGQPTPVGVAGELLFGGDNLARGYLHRPNLSAERFVPNPFGVGGTRDLGLGAGEQNQEPRTKNQEPDTSNSKRKTQNAKLYRTGDLARYRPDGTIEFLGRADSQVKIRGYRIEPGEIETVLAQHPQVREAVVVVRPDPRGAKQLVAYVVPVAQEPSNGHAPAEARPLASELRLYLREKLPDYMVPAAFAVLERWPLTPSGKIDRRALPAPGEQAGGRAGFLAPRDTLELQIARIWEELLGVKPVGIRESFFELGGHSLLVVRLMAQIHKQLGQKLPLATLFQEATVEHLAQALRQNGAGLPRTPLVAIQPNGTRLPFFCVHPGAGNVLSYLELARVLGPDQPFYGLQAAGLDGEEPPRESVEAMAEAYLPALRAAQPEGPYLLGGWSFGGMVAYEMARRLTAEGQEVALLALIDSWAPTAEPVAPADDVALLGWFAADLGRTLGADLSVSAEVFAEIAPERRLSYVLDQARAAQVLPPDIGEREIEQYIAVFKASLTAMGSYPRQPYAGRVTLFRAGDRPLDEAGPTLGWEGLAAGGVGLHVLPGDHYSIVRQPHVATLAEQLSACMDEVNAAREALGNA